MNKHSASLSDTAFHGQPPGDDGDEIDLRALLRTLWRGRWLILLLTCLGFAAGWYHASYRVTPYYQADATLTLEVAGERLVNFQNVTDGFYGDDAAVTTEMEVIMSRTMLGKLADRLDLVNDPMFNPALAPDAEPDPLRGAIATAKSWVKDHLGMPPPLPRPPLGEDAIREGIVSALAGMMSVSNKEWSYVLVISATSRNPEMAARLSNTLAELYIEDRLEVKFEKSQQATGWLTGRVVDLQREVERSANELKRFLADADLVSEDALAAMNLRLKDQRDRLSEARAMLSADEERLARVSAAALAADPARIVPLAADPALSRLEPRLDQDPEAERLFDTRLALVIERLTSEIGRSRNQVSVLEQAIVEQEAAIERQSEELVRVEQLEREAEANRLLYEYFLTRLKETSVQEGLQQADARIISPAIVPFYAFNPNGNRAILLATLLGLMAGAGLVLLRDHLITAVRTPDELEDATNLPMLGQIPRIPGRTRAAIIRYIARKPASAASEAVRNLRTSLVLSQTAAPPQLIVVTSALPGEGKSTTAVALAQNYAGLGKDVLLVEADIRRRTLAKFVGLSESDINMLSVLRGDAELAEAVQRTDTLNFDVLLGATAGINPADILSSEDFADMLSDARENYDVIIVDTPPLLVVPDARIAAQYADAVLFTVLWNRTTLTQVKDALRELSSTGVRASGLVLTNVDPKGMQQLGYGQRFGAYDRRLGKGYYRN